MKAKPYKVTAIVPKNPADMSDDITRRIGSTVLLQSIAEGEVLLWKYAKDAKGNKKDNWFRTSIVENVLREKNLITVETLNSTYKFELCA